MLGFLSYFSFCLDFFLNFSIYQYEQNSYIIIAWFYFFYHTPQITLLGGFFSSFPWRIFLVWVFRANPGCLIYNVDVIYCIGDRRWATHAAEVDAAPVVRAPALREREAGEGDWRCHREGDPGDGTEAGPAGHTPQYHR